MQSEKPSIFNEVYEILDFFKEDLEHNRKKLKFTKPKDLESAEIELFMMWRKELDSEFNKLIPEEKRAKYAVGAQAIELEKGVPQNSKTVAENIVDIELLKDQLSQIVNTMNKTPVKQGDSSNGTSEQLGKIVDQQQMLASTLKQMQAELANTKKMRDETPHKQNRNQIVRADSQMSTPQFSARGARVASRAELQHRDDESEMTIPSLSQNPPLGNTRKLITQNNCVTGAQIRPPPTNMTAPNNIRPQNYSQVMPEPQSLKDQRATAPIKPAKQALPNASSLIQVNEQHDLEPPEQTFPPKPQKASYKLKFTIYDQIKDENIKKRLSELGAFQWEPKPEGFKEAGLEWSVLGADREGGLYEGQRLNGRKHGRGVYMHDDYLFEGYFSNDVLEGRARKIYDDGDVFDAFWKAGSRFGYSVDHYHSGAKFKGFYEDDYRKGKGTFQWENGCKWEGEFYGGYMNGAGTWTQKNGETRELVVEYEIPEEFDPDTV